MKKKVTSKIISKDNLNTNESELEMIFFHMRASYGLAGESEEKVTVWLDTDRARCFQQIMLLQRLLAFLIDLTGDDEDVKMSALEAAAADLKEIIPPILFDKRIKKQCWFSGIAGTMKTILDSIFADNKAKIKDAMLATSGQIATKRNS